MSDIKMTTEQAIYCLSNAFCDECKYKVMVRDISNCHTVAHNMGVEALKEQKIMQNAIEQYEGILEDLGKENDNLREENEALKAELLKAQLDKPKPESQIEWVYNCSACYGMGGTEAELSTEEDAIRWCEDEAKNDGVASYQKVCRKKENHTSEKGNGE